MTSSKDQLVFLVGEGPSDIGDLALEVQYRGSREGFFQPLLRRLVAPLALRFDGRKMTSLPKRSTSRRGRLDLSKKPAQALALAHDLTADVLVYVRDLDRQQGTRATPRNRAKQLREMLDDLERAFQAAKTRDQDLAGLPVVIAIPAWMLESWVLADLDAIETASSRKVARGAFSGRSEDLWGDENDPGSNHPKCVLGRVVEEKLSAPFFADVATTISFKALSDQCRDSYPRFIEALQSQGLAGSPRDKN
jgi:hypothetical protein